MIHVPEIRDEVLRYLQHQIPLEALHEWLAARSWNMHLDSSLEAQRFVGGIELRLAEYDLGHFSEQELRHALEELVHAFDSAAVAAV